MVPELGSVNRKRVLAVTIIITAILLLGSGGLSRLAHANAIARATAAAEATRAAEATAEASMTTVGRVFENSDSIEIFDHTSANPYPSEIIVSGLTNGQILDLDLVLNGFNHSYPDDVDILLVAPNGKTAWVMSDAGGDPDANDLTLEFTGDLASALPDEGSLGGNGDFVRYGPANYDGDDAEAGTVGTSSVGDNTSLSAFAGDDPNGTWSLYVWDDSADDAGIVSDGWAIKINARVQR